jgi:exopolysaccharide biosynthesis polyprenyl glycosylphosphotransferase
MKPLPCPDRVTISPKPRQSDAIDEIRQVVKGATLPHSRFRVNDGGGRSHADRGQQSRSDSLTLHSSDRRRKERPALECLPSSLSPKTDSGPLLPRPYLMTSKASWTALDFAIALCCGCITILRSRGHLISLQTWPPPGNAGLLLPLFIVVEVIMFACIVAGLSRIFQLQPLERVHTVSSELLLIILSVSLAAIGVCGALGSAVSPTSTSILLEFLLTSSALFLCRVFWRRHWEANFERDIARRNILIVGAESIGLDIRDHLTSLRYLGFRFKGFVALKEESEDATLIGDSAIASDVDNLIPLARSMFVDEIIFSRRPTTANILSEVLSQAQAARVDVRLIPSFSETLKNRSDVEYLGNLPTIVLHRRKKRPMSNLLKRVIDVVLASIGIALASPLFLIIAVMIKLQSPGPVMYKSTRVGFKGTTFYCYKFRSMIEKADSMQEQLGHLNERSDILFKIAKDPRVTRVGAFLRKYSLDELPQLWNVLKGDMSLVGPRPSIRTEVAQYKTAHLRRLDVIPGMTGLWQVEARQDPSFESYVSLDSKYVVDWSIWLDFKILARTFGAVLKGTGT